MKVLIIEDEKHALEVIKAYLEKEGYETYIAQNGKAGLELFYDIQPDFLILDLMLPDITGEKICETVRQVSSLPILMLTAKNAIDDRINGLQLGADDYLVKPFSPRELVMRIKTIMRRLNLNKPVQEHMYADNYLKIDEIKHTVYVEDKALSLTPNEFKLLLFLCKNKNQVFSREQLITQIMGCDYDGYDRTIDVHIKNLRKKIETDPKDTHYIKTVFGIGYKFEGDSE